MSEDQNTYTSTSHNGSGGGGISRNALIGLAAGAAVTGLLIARKYNSDNKDLDAEEGGKQIGSGKHGYTRTETVLRPASELWAFWRDEENAPRFMKYIQSVTRTGKNTSHWVMQHPGGPKIEWVSEIFDEQPGRVLAWRTVRGDWKQTGRVLFRPAPGDRGTEVRLEMNYDIPGGALAEAIATVVGRAPEQLGQQNLHRFKQLMEAGEIITVDGQPHGKRGAKGTMLQVLLREPEVERTASKAQSWASGKQVSDLKDKVNSAVGGTVNTMRERWNRVGQQTSSSNDRGRVADAPSSSTWKRVKTGV